MTNTFGLSNVIPMVVYYFLVHVTFFKNDFKILSNNFMISFFFCISVSTISMNRFYLKVMFTPSIDQKCHFLDAWGYFSKFLKLFPIFEKNY